MVPSMSVRASTSVANVPVKFSAPLTITVTPAPSISTANCDRLTVAAGAEAE